jgi:hypothetical protein
MANPPNPPIKWWRDSVCCYAKVQCPQCGHHKQLCREVRVGAWDNPDRQTELLLSCLSCNNAWAYAWDRTAEDTELPVEER